LRFLFFWVNFYLDSFWSPAAAFCVFVCFCRSLPSITVSGFFLDFLPAPRLQLRWVHLPLRSSLPAFLRSGIRSACTATCCTFLPAAAVTVPADYRFCRSTLPPPRFCVLPAAAAVTACRITVLPAFLPAGAVCVTACRCRFWCLPAACHRSLPFCLRFRFSACLPAWILHVLRLPPFSAFLPFTTVLVRRFCHLTWISLPCLQAPTVLLPAVSAVSAPACWVPLPHLPPGCVHLPALYCTAIPFSLPPAVHRLLPAIPFCLPGITCLLQISGFSGVSFWFCLPRFYCHLQCYLVFWMPPPASLPAVLQFCCCHYTLRHTCHIGLSLGTFMPYTCISHYWVCHIPVSFCLLPACLLQGATCHFCRTCCRSACLTWVWFWITCHRRSLDTYLWVLGFWVLDFYVRSAFLSLGFLFFPGCLPPASTSCRFLPAVLLDFWVLGVACHYCTTASSGYRRFLRVDSLDAVSGSGGFTACLPFSAVLRLVPFSRSPACLPFLRSAVCFCHLPAADTGFCLPCCAPPATARSGCVACRYLPAGHLPSRVALPLRSPLPAACYVSAACLPPPVTF